MKPKSKKDYPFVVECENIKQTNAVLNHHEDKNDKWEHWKYVMIKNDLENRASDYIEHWTEKYRQLNIITYSEWLQLPDYAPEEVAFKEPEGQSDGVHLLKKISGIDKEFVLPEKWGIQGCTELQLYLADKGTYFMGFDNSKYYFISDKGTWLFEPIKNSRRKAITFDQFKEHVLYPQEIKLQDENHQRKVEDIRLNGNLERFAHVKFDGMDYHTLKEIKRSDSGCEFITQGRETIGYKLIKEQYYDAYVALRKGRYSANDFDDKYITTENNTSLICHLQEAGVLDVWFEAVYEQDPYQELFNYMSEQYGLTLLESEMQDIINIVNKIQK